MKIYITVDQKTRLLISIDQLQYFLDLNPGLEYADEAEFNKRK